MKSQRTVFSASTILFVVCVFFESLHAQPMPPFFIDDFEDGSATDGMPVSWVAPEYADTGTRQVIDGSFVLSAAPREFSMDTDVQDFVYGDVSIRTQFMSPAEDIVGLYLRSTLSGSLGDPSQGQQIFGYVTGDGILTLGRLVAGNLEFLEDVSVNWDPTGQEVHMQMDLFDGLLTMSTWRDGTDRPEPPQISYDFSSTGDLVSQGRIGIWIFPPQTGDLGPVAFRYVQAVPEPSNMFLFAMGAATAAAIIHTSRMSAVRNHCGLCC